MPEVDRKTLISLGVMEPDSTDIEISGSGQTSLQSNHKVVNLVTEPAKPAPEFQGVDGAEFIVVKIPNSKSDSSDAYVSRSMAAAFADDNMEVHTQLQRERLTGIGYHEERDLRTIEEGLEILKRWKILDSEASSEDLSGVSGVKIEEHAVTSVEVMKTPVQEFSDREVDGQNQLQPNSIVSFRSNVPEQYSSLNLTHLKVIRIEYIDPELLENKVVEQIVPVEVQPMEDSHKPEVMINEVMGDGFFSLDEAIKKAS